MHLKKFISPSVVISAVLLTLTACGDGTPDPAKQVQQDASTQDSAQIAAASDAGKSSTAEVAEVDDTANAAAAEDTAIAATDTAVQQGDAQVPVSSRVLITTSMGEIEVELDAEKAPVTVANFLAYIDSGHFDGTVFHRVIGGFMIQGGGFTENYQQKAVNDPIENEAANGLKNVKYSLAMARTGVVNSATAQFFINVADNAFLDHRDTTVQGFGYAVFGEVVSGKEVVDAIASVQTGGNNRFPSDVPVETVVIQSITRQ